MRKKRQRKGREGEEMRNIFQTMDQHNPHECKTTAFLDIRKDARALHVKLSDSLGINDII